MKTFSKYMTAAAGAAMMAATAAPAEAQYYDRSGHYDRGGIDAGDIITGVAILGGIAAIAGAFSRDRDRYGYANRDRYRDDYQNAVNSCGYEAERHARYGQIRITDVDRVSRNRYRVRGTIESGNDRYDRYNRYDRYDRRYDRSDRYGRYDSDRFTCYAYGNGRIQDFDIRG